MDAEVFIYFKDRNFKDERKIENRIKLPTMEIRIEGGFYYSKALHIYDNSEFPFHDILYRTDHIKGLYKAFLPQDIVCFAEDIFANQFIISPEGVFWLIIETGKIEKLGQGIEDWASLIIEESNYYAGGTLFRNWCELNRNIDYYERLTPKIPFMLGGLYEIDNLYANNFEKIVEFNASLAMQTSGLNDGDKVRIVIE